VAAPTNPPQQIQAYRGGGFRVSGERFEGSVLIGADRTIAWPAKTIDDISAATLALLVAEAAPGVIVMIGCGRSFQPMPKALRQELAAAGFHAEWMDTGAACRTFNLLVSEGREIRAALLAVE
jgi:uncharacterized protein